MGYLASGRLTVWLLAALAVALGVYLFVPQEGETGARALEFWIEQQGVVGQLCRTLRLTNVMHTPFIWGPCLLMFVNLVLCMIRRRATLGLCRFPEDPPQPGPSWLHREVAAAEIESARVSELLRREGYRTLVDGDRIYGLRGRFAILGHWIFHLALLALLIAGTAVALAPPRFRCSMGVGEGEPFDLHTFPLLTFNQPVHPDLPTLQFQVDEIEAIIDGSDVRRFEADVSTPEGESDSIAINRPFRRAPYQVMLHGFGYMAAWAIADERDRKVSGAWVKLIPFPLERSDTFPIGRRDSSAHVRFFPDHESEGENNRTRSQELRNPRFAARIVWRGETVYNGLLAPDQRVPLGGGFEFFFLPEVRKYALLEVIEERGYASVFGCLVFMILGLAIRYVRIRKEILVQRVGGGLRVFGHGETFESLFAEEFAHLADALKTAANLQDDGESTS